MLTTSHCLLEKTDKKKHYDFTESHAEFVARTRLFTKKRKNWQKRKKPEHMKAEQREIDMEKELNRTFKTILGKKAKKENPYADMLDIKDIPLNEFFYCPYCYEFYNPPWESGHGLTCSLAPSWVVREARQKIGWEEEEEEVIDYGVV